MKLISCYIEGYGKIKQKEYIFDRELSVFCKQNGEGKTTLASFIKAMFYGLKGYDSRSKEFCDREHFYPFDGGKFGGNLTFEMDGKTYEIKRFFGEKREKEDTLTVYENGEKYEAFGEDIGVFVFKVDRESFERTLFLRSDDIEITPTSGIRTRLNQVLEGSADDNEIDVEKAKKALHDAAGEYKSRAGKDKITAEKERISKLKNQIENASEIRDSLEGKYEKLTALEGEIEALSDRFVKAQEENEKHAHKEHYDDLRAKISAKEEEQRVILSRYPNGLPSEAETIAINGAVVQEGQLKTKLEGGVFSLSDEQKLERLKEVFSQGVPTKEQLFAVEKEDKDLSETTTKINILDVREMDERDRELWHKFSFFRPSAEALSGAEQTLESYEQTKGEYEQTPDFLFVAPTAKKKSSAGYIATAVIAAIVAVLGGVLCLFNGLLGGALLGLGGLTLLIDGFCYLNRKTAQASAQPQENPEKRKLEALLRTQEDAIKAFLLPLGYHSANGLAYDFSILKKDLEDYARLAQTEDKRRADLDGLRADEKALSARLDAFFATYAQAGEGYTQKLSNLRVRLHEYNELRSRRQRAEAEKMQTENELNDVREKIAEYQKKYALQTLSVVAVSKDIQNAERLEKELSESREKAAAYKAEKGLDEKISYERIDLDDLQAKIQEKQKEQVGLKRQIEEDETEAENLDGYEADMKSADELLKEYNQKHKLLTAAEKLIEKAEGQLLTKYVEPIYSEFTAYAELLEAALGEKVHIDKEFNLTFERGGERRSERHLSAGQRSVCALCFRLALIKNMYKEQTPFLILDDPFTSLDAVHMERVASVLKALSKDMQMLYFTCHESRNL